MPQNVNQQFTFCPQNTRLLGVCPPNSELYIRFFSLLLLCCKSKIIELAYVVHVKVMFSMSINCIALGKRISFYRLKFNMTQEKLADLTDCSREYIAYLESGAKTPSLPILINLANVLHISVDELLVDSLDYSISSSDSDLHRLLLDCSEVEQTVIIRMAKELKATLVSLGI